jgi:hypothetical protein
MIVPGIHKARTILFLFIHQARSCITCYVKPYIQSLTKMPAVSWTTDEQYKWLQEWLATYMVHAKEKDYTHFWPSCCTAWFQRFPERAVIFPDIPTDVDLTPEQEAILQEARGACESVRHFVLLSMQCLTIPSRIAQQLQTWFRWCANSSKKNRSLKKKLTVFESALQPKRRTKSEAKIYSDMFYDERIKPLVTAEAEAGNVTTSGKCVALGRKFSKELLNDESEDVKAEVRAKHEQQLTCRKGAKRGKSVLDDEEGNEEIDAELPIICQRFAQLVKQ